MIQIILTILLLISFSSGAQPVGSTDFAYLLNTADQNRSANPQLLSKLLDEIDPEQLTSDQLELFQYLEAYKIAISGQLNKASELYWSIYTNAKSDIKYRALVSYANNKSLTQEWFEGAFALSTLVDNEHKIKDLIIKHRILGAVSLFYNQLGEYRRAKVYAEKLLQEQPEKRLVCIGWTQLLEAQLNLGESMNVEHFNEALRVCAESGEEIIRFVVLGHLARFYEKENDSESALELLLPAIGEVEKTKYKTLISEVYSLVAEASYKLNDIDTATMFSERLVNTLEFEDYKKPLASAHFILHDIARNRGNYELALKHFRWHSIHDKAFKDVTLNKQLAYQQARLEAAEKNSQIALLDKENTLLRTQNELAEEQAQNNRLALALACTLMVLLFFWVYRSRRLQNQLRKLAEVDDLTGICNRHHFNTRAAQTLNWSKQTRQPVSFLLFDLDHFKKVNDSFGHQTGDWVLKKAVDAAQTVCRSNDIIGRMGGEEFAILLPGCTLEKAVEIAEMCRKKIEGVDTSETGETFTISASFGVADNQRCSHQLEKLFAGADAALYEAKQAGRNQIKTYHESDEPVPV